MGAQRSQRTQRLMRSQDREVSMEGISAAHLELRLTVKLDVLLCWAWAGSTLTEWCVRCSSVKSTQIGVYLDKFCCRASLQDGIIWGVTELSRQSQKEITTVCKRAEKKHWF